MWRFLANLKIKMAPTPANLSVVIKELVANHRLLVFSKTTCSYCAETKTLLTKLHQKPHVVELDEKPDMSAWQDELKVQTGQRSVPNIFINGEHVGGNDNLHKLFNENKLVEKLRSHTFQYDLIVIGGGSGGLAAAKEAALYGAKTAVFDYVTKTPAGTSWGLGGTCVNVGCIPKKLMHQAALIKESVKDSEAYGWTGIAQNSVTMKWEDLVQGVQDHIGSLNWGYRVQLREKNVQYFNQWATLVDAHTVRGKDKDGKEVTYTADKVLIAVGERPNYPDIPGAKNFAITSDDLFSLKKPPGDTVVIGASYVALECAGFLAAMGFKVTVVVRSILLRGFDTEMSEMAGKYMEKHGVTFVRPAVPVKIEKSGDKLSVSLKDPSSGDEQTLSCDTVLFAIGRAPVLESLNLPKLGVSLSKAGRIVVNSEDRTTADNVFAIGDAAEGRPQLTPAAIQAGRLLAKRLYGASDVNCDYDNIPTTVFTPLEYSCCGLSEDVAVERFGQDGIVVYHQYFTPLEWTVPHREDNTCYMKVICDADSQKIIGIHYLGPNAGEVMQGFALGIRAGATKNDLDMIVGIHPTNAEWFTTLSVVKGSGDSAATAGC